MTDPASSERVPPAAATAASTATACDGDGDDDDNTAAAAADATVADALPITLGAATAVDVPALIDLHTAAFGADLFSHLMLLGRPPGTHEGFMRRALDAWLADPDAHVVRAVDADGAVVGWACWVRKTAVPSSSSSSSASASASGRAAGADKEEGKENEKEGKEEEEEGDEEDGPRALGRRMRADLVRWEAAHAGAGPYLVLQALATDPARQGRGVGSRLVRWGTARAAARGLACWAHASPAGHGLYARAGFEELGRSDYDLAAWAPGGRAGRRGWGLYTFRYMLRRPPAAAPGDDSGDGGGPLHTAE